MLRLGPLALLAGLAIGCTDTLDMAADGELDGVNDDVGDGKADTAGIRPGTQDSYAVVNFANLATAAQLRAAGLGSAAAGNIVAYRLGDDETDRTEDDQLFDSLAELDTVPYVGPKAFKAMLAYTRGKVEYARPLFDGAWFLVVDSLPGFPQIVLRGDFKVTDDNALTRELRMGSTVLPIAWGGADYLGFTIHTNATIDFGNLRVNGATFIAEPVDGRLMCGQVEVTIPNLGTLKPRLTVLRADISELPDTTSLCP